MVNGCIGYIAYLRSIIFSRTTKYLIGRSHFEGKMYALNTTAYIYYILCINFIKLPSIHNLFISYCDMMLRNYDVCSILPRTTTTPLRDRSIISFPFACFTSCHPLASVHPWLPVSPPPVGASVRFENCRPYAAFGRPMTGVFRFVPDRKCLVMSGGLTPARTPDVPTRLARWRSTIIIIVIVIIL